MSATTEMPGESPEPIDEGLELVLPSRGVPVGEAIAWIGEGWKLFARSPLMWIIALVILFVIALAFAFIPIIGQVAFQILNPVFSAGFVVACRAIERGGEFELEHLFAGFKRNFGKLAIVGLIFLGLSLVVLLVFSIFFGVSMLTAFLSGNTEQALETVAASAATLVLGGLVCMALFVPILAAYWFAPALVVMHGMSPVAAMKESFFGCLRNILPMLVWGIVMGVLMILGSLPFGLGLLVVVPMMVGSSYAAYRSIFTRERGEAESRPVMVG
jgi:uncharacterized membrane protein